MELTQARLKELLHYDPETGMFTRLACKRRDRVGKTAGYTNSKGYVVISVDNKQAYAHRLAWLYMSGAWPLDQVDHRDTDKANNRFVNLREADDIKNQQNRRAAKKGTASGLLGAYQSKVSGRWSSRITVEGKQLYLGSFNSPELAAAAYLSAKRIHHPTAFA